MTDPKEFEREAKRVLDDAHLSITGLIAEEYISHPGEKAIYKGLIRAVASALKQADAKAREEEKERCAMIVEESEFRARSKKYPPPTGVFIAESIRGAGQENEEENANVPSDPPDHHYYGEKKGA